MRKALTKEKVHKALEYPFIKAVIHGEISQELFLKDLEIMKKTLEQDGFTEREIGVISHCKKPDIIEVDMATYNVPNLSKLAKEIRGKNVDDVTFLIKEQLRFDFEAWAKTIDNTIKEHFSMTPIVMRAVSIDEHEEKDIPAIFDHIALTGTDRYDDEAKGKGYDRVECDLFAGKPNMLNDEYMSKRWLVEFFKNPVEHGKDPLRIDIIVIYDERQMELIHYTHPVTGKRPKDAFKFKDINSAAEAVLAVIHIPR